MSRKTRTRAEEASGFGKLYRDDEFALDVLYNVAVYQEWIHPRPSDPPLKGHKEITGRVTAPESARLSGEKLTNVP